MWPQLCCPDCALYLTRVRDSRSQLRARRGSRVGQGHAPLTPAENVYSVRRCRHETGWQDSTKPLVGSKKKNRQIMNSYTPSYSTVEDFTSRLKKHSPLSAPQGPGAATAALWFHSSGCPRFPSSEVRAPSWNLKVL